MSVSEIPGLIIAYETWLYEKSYLQSMEELYTYSHDEDNNAVEIKVEWIKKALRVISGPQYELIMNIITIINVLTVFVRSFMQDANASTIKNWMQIQIAVNFVLLFEMLADFLIAGPVKVYVYHFRVWPETFCQIINIFALVRYFENKDETSTYNQTVKLFEVIVFVRMLKLLSLLYEVKVMRVIFETIKNLLGPINNIIVVMVTMLYVFA